MLPPSCDNPTLATRADSTVYVIKRSHTIRNIRTGTITDEGGDWIMNNFIDYRSIIQLLLLPSTTAATPTTDVNGANPTVKDILWARGNMLE